MVGRVFAGGSACTRVSHARECYLTCTCDLYCRDLATVVFITVLCLIVFCALVMSI